MSAFRFLKPTLVFAVLASTVTIFGASTVGGADLSPTPVVAFAETNYTNMYSITSDPSGDIFGVDATTGDIFEIPLGQSTLIALANDPNYPTGITYHDGLLYISNYDMGAIETLPATGGPLTVLSAAAPETSDEASGENFAWDSAGDLFVANYSNNVVEEIPAGTSTEVDANITIPAGCNPWALAITGSTMYISCYDGGELLRTSVPVPGGGETPTDVATPSIYYAGSMSLDNAGNLYIANYDYDQIVMLPAGSSSASVLPTTGLDLDSPWGSTFANDELYVSNYDNPNAIDELILSLRPVTNLVVTQSATSVSATWAVNGSGSYVCTLLYGFNNPTTYSETTTSPSCSFAASGASFGISVVPSGEVGTDAVVSAFPQIAPPTTTSTTAPPKVKKTIICVKGKVTRRVTALSPHCPAGYKKR